MDSKILCTRTFEMAIAHMGSSSFKTSIMGKNAVFFGSFEKIFFLVARKEPFFLSVNDLELKLSKNDLVSGFTEI